MYIKSPFLKESLLISYMNMNKNMKMNMVDIQIIIIQYINERACDQIQDSSLDLKV